MKPRAALPHQFLSLGLPVLPAGGCASGDGLPRQEVWGKVTFDGQPLASGTIQFQPAGNNEGEVVSGGSVINGGSYRIKRDAGLVPGNYKVLIVSHVDAKQANLLDVLASWSQCVRSNPQPPRATPTGRRPRTAWWSPPGANTPAA